MTAPLAKAQLKRLSPTNLSFADRAGPVQASRGMGLARLLSDTVRWVATWPSRQATLDELSRLTERELTDIGLTRADVRHVFTRRR